MTAAAYVIYGRHQNVRRDFPSYFEANRFFASKKNAKLFKLTYNGEYLLIAWGAHSFGPHWQERSKDRQEQKP